MSAGSPAVAVGESRWVNASFGLLAWIVGLIFFFPVFWMVLSAFKEEQDANTAPKLFFDPTLDRFDEVTASAGGLLSFGEAFTNSAVVVLVSTLIVLALAIPAAYALAIRPVHKWRDVLFFFISTKFLPGGGLDPADLDPGPGARAAEHAAGADHPLHGHQPAAGRVDAALVLPGDPARADRGGRDRRRRPARAADVDHPADGRTRASPPRRCCA